MAVKSKEELLKAINEIVGEEKSNELITVFEDLSDTLDANKLSADDITWKEKYEKEKSEWEVKYNTLDKDWKEKYKERFFNPSSEETDDTDKDGSEDEKPKVTKYEDLFSAKE